MWSVVDFGRYQGKTLPQIIFTDPDWFFWAIEENRFHAGLEGQAEMLAARVRNIRIPRPNPQDWCVRYVTHNDKFARFDIIEVSISDRFDSPGMFRRDRLDLKVPRLLKSLR